MRSNNSKPTPPKPPRLNAFVGFDGFVDEILHVVDKRESADKYLRLPTITKYAERLAGAPRAKARTSNWSTS